MPRQWSIFDMPELRTLSFRGRLRVIRVCHAGLDMHAIVGLAALVLVLIGCAFWMGLWTYRAWGVLAGIAATLLGLGVAYLALLPWILGPMQRQLRRSIRRRFPDGRLTFCPDCGYDLRGSPGEHCPECGAAVRLAESRGPR